MKQSDNAFLGLGVKVPALAEAPGIAPWNPNQLNIWTSRPLSQPMIQTLSIQQGSC